MAEMRDFAREAWEAVTHAEHAVTGEVSGWFHRDTAASQAPGTAPVTVKTDHEGETMSALSDKLHGIATTVESVEEEDLPRLAAVLGNPATADLFAVLHQVSGLDLAPILGAVKTILQPYVPAA